MTRISTFSTYYIASNDIQALQVGLQERQAKLNSQKRVNKPSDDPIATAQIQLLSQARDRTAQFIKNGEWAKSSLEAAESTVSSAVDLLSNLKALMIHAGNGIANDDDFLTFQQQVKQSFQQLLSYANMSNGTGQYLFSGDKVDVVPFMADAALNVTYQGDNGQRAIEITDSSQMSITDPGSLLFGNGTDAVASFKMVKTFYDLLGRPPSRNPNYSSELSNVIGQLDESFSQLVNAHASIGARLKQNDDILQVNQGVLLSYKLNISSQQDLDVAKAITELVLMNTALSYSKDVYMKLAQTALIR